MRRRPKLASRAFVACLRHEVYLPGCWTSTHPRRIRSCRGLARQGSRRPAQRAATSSRLQQLQLRWRIRVGCCERALASRLATQRALHEWTHCGPRRAATLTCQCIRINESHDDEEECSQHNVIHTCSLSTQAPMKALHDLAHAKHISQPACADAELFSDALFTFGYLQLPSVSLRDWQFLQWLWSCLAQLLSQYS
jgi:hypothetical protein